MRESLLSLVPRPGGLGIPTFEELCETEYQNLIMISEHLCYRIADQFRTHETDPEAKHNTKQIKSLINDQQKS